MGEKELADYPKSELKKRFPGFKHGKGTGLFFRNAEIIGSIAKDEQTSTCLPVMAVLFRDADSTRTSKRTEWENKFHSIMDGFESVPFNAGVPMVPRPKSEAWLLCGLNYRSNAGCDELEEAPGNDNSPKSLKKQLAALMGHDPSAEEQADWIKSGRIDPANISMPSFTAFRDALELAINNALNPC